MRRKISPKFHVKNGVKNGTFHANFTLLERSADFILRCSFFAYNWKLPAHSGAFLLTADNFSFFTYSWSFFAYSFSFFANSWSFFAYSGKVRLIRAFRDCKQKSSTVSKKAPTVRSKSFPLYSGVAVVFSGSLRAKGILISEPRLPTPCEM